MTEKRIHLPVNRYEGVTVTEIWTDDQKQVLLSGLMKYGHKDPENIAKLLPNKSVSAIKLMIGSLMKAADQSTVLNKTPPIDMWLEQASSDDTNTLIPQALLFISLFEKHELPENSNGCDWRAAYNFIYRITQGYPGSDLSLQTRKTIYKVVSKTVSKMRYKNSANLLKFTNNLYKSSLQKDYTRKSKVPRKIGPSTVLQELNTFSVPSDQLRIS